jgi:hypothetical protein
MKSGWGEAGIEKGANNDECFSGQFEETEDPEVPSRAFARRDCEFIRRTAFSGRRHRKKNA